MPAAAEFTGPTSYSPWLTWLAVLLPLLVLAWYVGVTWWARPRGRWSPRRLRTLRRDHLARLDRVEADVAAGDLSLRSAHQAISELVRSFAAQVGPLDARPLTLEQLRVVGPSGLVDVVALVYPPEFSPGAEGEPAERLAPALADARLVITEWRR